MARSLGIFVSSDQHLDKILKLCEAAKSKGTEVTLFLTHLGTLLTQDPGFTKLVGKAEMSLCKVSLESQGIKKSTIPGMDEKDFATQAKHAEILEECDRYIVF